MKIFIMIFLFMATQTSYSDNTRIDVKMDHAYEIAAEYPALVDKGRFIFSRYDESGNTRSIIAESPFLKKETVLVAGEKRPEFLAEDPSYIAFYAEGSGVPGRVKLLRKSDGKIMQSGRLSQGAFTAYFLEKHIYVKQFYSKTSSHTHRTSHWSVFDVPSLEFSREFDTPMADIIERIGRKTVFLDRTNSVGVYDDKLKEIYSERFPIQYIRNGSCSPDSLITTNSTAFFVANCGEIYSLSLTSGELKPRIRLDQRFYSLASDGTYLFATPKAPTELPGETDGIVIRLSTWKVVGKFKAMGEVSYTNGKSLAVLSFPKWRKGLISIYTYAPENITRKE